MASATGFVVVKQFEYRDDPAEQWTNKYWLSGPPPGPSSEWRILFDQLVNIEKNVYTSRTKVVGGYGYNDNSDTAVATWGVDLTALGQEVSGTLPRLPGNDFAGDQAGIINWKTERKSTRGKWIYLRKYFHDGQVSPTDSDALSTETIAAYDTFAGHLELGDWAGARTLQSQRGPEVITFSGSTGWVTTRTLKRRGKRP